MGLHKLGRSGGDAGPGRCEPRLQAAKGSARRRASMSLGRRRKVGEVLQWRYRRCLGLRQGGEAGDGRREDGSVRFLAGAGAKRQQGRARGSAAPNPWRAPEAARKVVRRRQQEREMGDKREGRGRPGSGRRWWCSGGRPVLGWLRPRVLAAVGAPAPMVADEGGRNRWMRGSRGGAGWWGEIERWRATGWRPRGFLDRRRGHLDR